MNNINQYYFKLRIAEFLRDQNYIIDTDEQANLLDEVKQDLRVQNKKVEPIIRES